MKVLFSTLLTLLIFVLFPIVANAADPDYGAALNWNGYIASSTFSGTGSGQWAVYLYTSITDECENPASGQAEWYYWNGTSWTGIYGGTSSCTSIYPVGFSGWTLVDGRTYVKFMRSPFPGVGTVDQTNADGYVSFSYASTTGITPGEGPPPPCAGGQTCIVDFNPQEGETVTGPGIDFDLEVYVNPDDIGTIKGVTVTMRNIDQNVLLLGVFSPSDIVLLDEYQLPAGTFNYSTTSIPLADGNYRLRVCLDANYFGLGFGVIGGWITEAAGGVNLCESHQFVVGTSTFIGNISQNLWSDTQSFFGNSTATSSEALAATCNPFLAAFGIRECMAFLFVPDNNQLQLTLTEARNAFLTRIPWGYFTRTIDIMSSPASSTLPAFSTSIQIGAGSDLTPATTTLSFDINDMVVGAGSLVDSIEATGSGVSFRDVFYPIIQGTIALLVLLTIIADLSNTHNHASGESRQKTKTS